MKNIFKIAAIAVVALSLTVSCKSKTEEPVDTMPAEEMIVEDTIDTIEEVAEAVVAEEPVKVVTKKETKKETVNPTAAPKVTPTDLSKTQTTEPAARRAAGAKTAENVKTTPTDLSKEAPANPAQRARR